MDSNKPGDRVTHEAGLVCEALCREIANAGRWTHVLDAWNALLTVRRMERDLVKEQRILAKSFSGAPD